MKLIDLTHTLSDCIPSWDGKADFALTAVTDYKDCTPPDLFRTQKIHASVSLGTHLDAPAHVIHGGRTMEKLTFEELVVDNVANADLLPATGAKVFVLPMKIQNATEAPLRLIAVT